MDNKENLILVDPELIIGLIEFQCQSAENQVDYFRYRWEHPDPLMSNYIDLRTYLLDLFDKYDEILQLFDDLFYEYDPSKQHKGIMEALEKLSKKIDLIDDTAHRYLDKEYCPVDFE